MGQETRDAGVPARCDECEHPDDVAALTKCEACGVLFCGDCYGEHARECHDEDCMCSTCCERRVCAAESLRDAMEDR